MRIDGRTIPDVYNGPDMNVRRDGRIGHYQKVVTATKKSSDDSGSQQESASQTSGGSGSQATASASLSFVGSLNALSTAQTARDSLKNMYTDQTGVVRQPDEPYKLYDSRAKLRSASAPGSTINVTA